METKHKKYAGVIWATLLILVLAAVLVWFVVDLRNLHRSGAFRTAHSLRYRRLATASPLLLPAQIQGWMTFRYVNFVFHLPANFLSGKLNIADSAYPNITLDKYSGAHKLNQAAFVASARQAAASFVSGGGK